MSDPAPATVNPSLWRQGALCARQGLYEVTDGVYQIRGLDLSNMTLVEGERGVVVVDPRCRLRRPPPDSGCTASTRASLDGIEHEGDVGVLTRLLGLLDEPDPDFAIVTP